MITAHFLLTILHKQAEPIVEIRLARIDIYVNYKLQASVHLMDDETSIGREPSCHIQVPDARVSRKHAVIRTSQDGHEIENMSANGTKINGKPIDTPKLLKPGDVIFVSDYILAYQPDDVPPERVAETLLV